MNKLTKKLIISVLIICGFLGVNHFLLADFAPTRGMTNPMTAIGDLIIGSTSGNPAKLPIGSTGQVLTVASGTPTWATSTSSGGTWGTITGTLSSQTDLQNALNAKLSTTTAASTYLKLDQTIPQTTIGRFTFPDIAVDTNTLYTDSVNHRLGIGTSSPVEQVNIHSSGATDLLGLDGGIGYSNRFVLNTNWNGNNNYLGIRNLTYSATNPQFVFTDNGKFGVGTDNPQEKLSISGGNLLFTNTNTISTSQGIIKFSSPNYLGAYSGIQGLTNSAGSNQTELAFYTAYGTSAEAMRIDTHGNVGIGTTNPGYKLDVSGDIRTTTGNIYGANSMSENIGSTANYIGLKDSSGNNRINFYTGQTSYPIIYANDNTGAGTLLQIPNGIFVSSGTGYFGGVINARGGIFNDAGSYLQIGGGISGNTYFSGPVGIGNTNPLAKLQIGSWGIIDGGTDGNVGTLFGSNVYYSGGYKAIYNGNAIFSSYGNNGIDLYAQSAEPGLFTPVSRLHISMDGSVGIGTTNPTEKLSVVGNGLFSGTLTASNLSGTNTGDQNLSGYAPLASPSFTGTPSLGDAIATSLGVSSQIYGTGGTSTILLIKGNSATGGVGQSLVIGGGNGQSSSNGGDISINGGVGSIGKVGGNILFQTGFAVGGTPGLYKFAHSGNTNYGIFNFESITSSDKTFTFPNATGTIALTSDISSTSIGALINSSTATTTPAEADLFAIYGSVTSALQNITWTNLKAAIGSYISSVTMTLTNKRINPRIVSAASYTTDTGTSLDVSTTDEFVITAQAGSLKFNNPSGTPVEGQKLMIRIKDNGTARALTFDTQFRASSDLALPTTTVISKTMYLGFVYNATDSKWDFVSLLGNF